jgi:hypothetical protein
MVIKEGTLPISSTSSMSSRRSIDLSIRLLLLKLSLVLKKRKLMLLRRKRDWRQARKRKQSQMKKTKRAKILSRIKMCLHISQLNNTKSFYNSSVRQRSAMKRSYEPSWTKRKWNSNKRWKRLRKRKRRVRLLSLRSWLMFFLRSG